MLPLSLRNYYLLLVVLLCCHQSQTLGDCHILICTCKWKGLSGTWLGVPCPSSSKCVDPLVSPLSFPGLQQLLVLLLGRALHPRHYTWASPSAGCMRGPVAPGPSVFLYSGPSPLVEGLPLSQTGWEMVTGEETEQMALARSRA